MKVEGASSKILGFKQKIDTKGPNPNAGHASISKQKKPSYKGVFVSNNTVWASTHGAYCNLNGLTSASLLEWLVY